MIGKISGQIDYKGPDHVLIETRGVGYIVYCSERTLAALPARGGFAALYTELLVREDLLQLFGFLTLSEREWYRILTSVQGVGAKAALAILSALGVEGVSRALVLGDAGAIKQAQGIGPKLAQRITNELKDKAPKLMSMGHDASIPASPPEGDVPVIELEPVKPSKAAPPQPATSQTSQADALSALLNLGYGHSEAAIAVTEVLNEMPEADTSNLIRLALKKLAPKG